MAFIDRLTDLVGEFGRWMASVEARLDARTVNDRLGELERQINAVAGAIEAAGKNRAPIPAEAIAMLTKTARADARARGHDLGPWTLPATVQRPAHASCRAGGCSAFVAVLVTGHLQGKAHVEVCRGQGAEERRAEGGDPKTPRTFQPKACEDCGKTFAPTGPRNLYCKACREKRAAA